MSIDRDGASPATEPVTTSGPAHVAAWAVLALVVHLLGLLARVLTGTLLLSAVGVSFHGPSPWGP